MRSIKQLFVVLCGFILFVQIGYANGSRPTAPADVVAERTSDSTVFISWARSTDDLSVSGYNVYRDDKYISTVTNPRLADIQLAPDTIYSYYVIAFDANRNFSERSSVAFTDGRTMSVTLNPSDSTSTSSSSITVDGDRISWPNDGWYQVQDSLNYEEQCNGTRYCGVAPGNYVVINHSTGVRTSIVVGGSRDIGGDFINAGNALDIWESVVDVINGESLQNAFFEHVQNELNFRGPENRGLGGIPGITFSETRSIEPPYLFMESSERVDDVSDQRIYTCESGGSVFQYSSQQFTGFDNVFERCALGGNEYRGTAGARMLIRGEIARFPYSDFQRIASDGRVQTIDGEYYSGNASFAIIDIQNGWRNLSFADTSNELNLHNYNIDRTVFNGRLFMGETATVNGVEIRVDSYDVRETLQGSFSVNAPFTQEHTLQVSIDLAYADRVREAREDAALDFPGRDPQSPFEWQSGSVNISASDGSSMTVLPIEGNGFQIQLDTGESLGPFLWIEQYDVSNAARPTSF